MTTVKTSGTMVLKVFADKSSHLSIRSDLCECHSAFLLPCLRGTANQRLLSIGDMMICAKGPGRQLVPFMDKFQLIVKCQTS